MAYFSKYRLREAINERLREDLTDRAWDFVCVMLDVEEPFHMEKADLDYDIPRIKRLLVLLKIAPP